VSYLKNGNIILNSGGWRTVTTKDRINKYAPITIYQENSRWYVGNWNEKKYYFADNMKIDCNGNIYDTEIFSPEKEEEDKKLKRQVRNYARNFATALVNGRVDKPGGGDCFYCSLVDVNTKIPWGESANDIGHLVSHMDEKYYVPSLLVRANELYPISIFVSSVVGTLWRGTSEQKKEIMNSEWLKNISINQISKSLQRYMYKQFGYAA
jgi:hypothetical protein